MPLLHWVLGCLALTSSVLAQGCNKNACYSAVSSHRATFRRNPRNGCLSFLATTSTPVPITSTVTTFGDEPFIVTKTITKTVTKPTTTGVTETTTQFSISSTTTTKIVRTRTPPTNDQGITPENDVDENVPIGARATSNSCPAPSSIPSSIPSYASAVCANTAAYTSACACFGLTSVSTRILPRCTTIVYEVKQRTTTIRSTETIRMPKTTVTETIATDLNFVNTRTTTTYTSYSYSVTAPNVPGGPTPCGNQGMQFAVYENPYGDTSNNYELFNPAYFKTARRECTGRTGAMGIESYPDYDGPEEVDIYGQCKYYTTQYTINQRGYIYVPQTGVYRLRFYESVDNILLIWFGGDAYEGYTRANADFEATNYDSPALVDFQLDGPRYMAFRVMYGQNGLGARWNTTLRWPNGLSLLDPHSSKGRYVVTNSCDGVEAPAYPPFGQET